ncbi:hypothetical protein [Leptothoe sp. PORK10 BA2]|uniref:hypothetical protein n=1 Tax=Leptothoe sp. PORK10 BA2 TaxID=3110254 RepID=UPI002B21C9E3|nr:hypothetical protein [Leptothoe sp. PORK10 BA2]
MVDNAVRSQASLAGNSEWFGLYEYPSHGRRYYRLQWGVGRKTLGQLHVRGGAVGSKLADVRAAELGRWVIQGRTLAQCRKLVSSWDKQTSKGDTRGKPRRIKPIPQVHEPSDVPGP